MTIFDWNIRLFDGRVIHGQEVKSSFSNFKDMPITDLWVWNPYLNMEVHAAKIKTLPTSFDFWVAMSGDVGEKLTSQCYKLISDYVTFRLIVKVFDKDVEIIREEIT